MCWFGRSARSRCDPAEFRRIGGSDDPHRGFPRVATRDIPIGYPGRVRGICAMDPEVCLADPLLSQEPLWRTRATPMRLPPIEAPWHACRTQAGRLRRPVPPLASQHETRGPSSTATGRTLRRCTPACTPTSRSGVLRRLLRRRVTSACQSRQAAEGRSLFLGSLRRGRRAVQRASHGGCRGTLLDRDGPDARRTRAVFVDVWR